MPAFSDWIGREERSADVLAAPPARRWLATLDLTQADAAMPQGIHWCLCVPETPTARIGPDGHPLRDGADDAFLPPIAAPRRMWAGSECSFLAPLAIGVEITRVTRIEAIEEKHGGSGALTFVTLLHETFADDAIAVRERQTLVYRDAPPPGSPPVPPLLTDAQFDDSGWDLVERITPTLPLLFRYSALTFNTHRIHYDADYVRDQEGYRGPVVHGPLTATLLLQLAARHFGDNALKRFAFRGTSPAIADEGLVLALSGSGDAIELGAFAADGRPVMKAQAAI